MMVNTSNTCFQSVVAYSSRFQIDGIRWVVHSTLTIACARYAGHIFFRAGLGALITFAADLPYKAGAFIFLVVAVAALALKMLALVIAERLSWSPERTAFCLQLIQAICDVSLLVFVLAFGVSGFAITNGIATALLAAIVAYSVLRVIHTGWHNWNRICHNTLE